MKIGRPFSEYGTQKRVGRNKDKVCMQVRVNEDVYREIRLCAETLGCSMGSALELLVKNGLYRHATDEFSESVM